MASRVAPLLLAFALATVGPSAAADLDGTYVLDLEASESVAEVLTLSGAPKFVGKMADRTRVTVDVTTAGTEITLLFRTKVYQNKEVMIPDGETREVTSHGHARMVTQRYDERGGLESRTVKALEEGEQAFVCTYRLSDGGASLLEEYLLIRPDGTEHRATRVYVRAD